MMKNVHIAVIDRIKAGSYALREPFKEKIVFVSQNSSTNVFKLWIVLDANLVTCWLLMSF